MSESQTMISIRGVEKRFGPVLAVDDVTFDIRRGEFFSILGASGSGKTTLLRMLAGFEAATRGEIHIDGVPMDPVPPHLRPVNMVFQSYAIFPHLNVRDNIAFGLRKYGLGRSERSRRVDEMLELIKLPGYGDRRADQLSGGQRQRVALARALILRPKVLLLDEPLGALDKRLREGMQIELRGLQRSVGITFVLVTHDQHEALTLSDRIAVMADGKVLQVDAPDQLYEAPRTRTVASFVGSMNFLPARVVSRANGRARLDAGALGPRSVAMERLAADIGREICLAVRPEKILLHRRRPEGSGDAVAGTLADRVYLGERTVFHIDVAGIDQPIEVSVQNAALGGGAPIARGEQVWLTLADDCLIPLEAD